MAFDNHMLAVNTYDHSIMNIDLETGDFESVDEHDAIVWDLALVDDVLYASTYDGFQAMDPETLEISKLVDEEAAFASDTDEDGVLWLGRAGELGKFDPASGQYQTVIAEVRARRAAPSTTSRSVRTPSGSSSTPTSWSATIASQAPSTRRSRCPRAPARSRRTACRCSEVMSRCTEDCRVSRGKP